jgi:adenylyltransferase/sulfurtransferase
MGSLQALEAIKILSGIGGSYSQRLCLFDGGDGSMKVVKLRGKQASCAVCSDNASIKALDGDEYTSSCGMFSPGMHDKSVGLKLLEHDERITALDFKKVRESGSYALIDVRRGVEWNIARFNDAIHMPLNILSTKREQIRQLVMTNARVYVICRRGNDSQIAVRWIKEHVLESWPMEVTDVVGGYCSWARDVDESFPIY